MKYRLCIFRKGMTYMGKISASLLAADFANLGREVEEAVDGGCEYIHIDVMDGIFVPNISIGVPVVEALRKTTAAVFDVHLMITKPSLYLEKFIRAGADILTVHLEAEGFTEENLRAIRALGAKAGLTIKPATPVSAVEKYLPLCDLLLIMTVEPGFGGQEFIAGSLGRIREARTLIGKVNPLCELEIDGGVSEKNLVACAAAGANVFVMGSAVFADGQPKKNARRLLEIIR